MTVGDGRARVRTDDGSEYVELDDCSISFSENRREGRTTLIFLHGIGCSRAVWAPVLERLPQSWRLIAYDLRGGGQSKESVEHHLSLEKWASDLKVLLERWHVSEKPVVVGHSLGASIALEFALDYGDLPGALVLLGAEAGLCRLGPLMAERAKAIEESGLHGFVTGPWRKAPPFSEQSRAACPTMVDEYSEMIYETGAERYIRAVAAIAESPDLTARLSEIVLPSLVLIGGEDDRTLPEFGRELAAKLPDGEAVELAGVGHTLSLEAPERVAEEIGGFVEKRGLG